MTKKGRRMMLLFLAVVFGTVFISHFLIQRTRVNGDSMMPTLYDGDNLIMDKASYYFRDPRRFEMVVFSYQYRENTYYIKRVIALPGETVCIRDGVIYVNGKALIEHYGNELIEDGGLATQEITLAADEYFVLGDNRNTSVDSRDPSVGNIKKKDIVGRAWLCLTPFARFGFF